MTEQQLAAMRQALEGVASMARCGQLDAFIGEPWLNAVFAAIEQAETAQGQEPHSWYSAALDEWMTNKTYKEHGELKSYTHIVGGVYLPLYTAASQPALEQYPLPDDLYDSKDWRDADYAGRVEWLHTMYESLKQTLDAYTGETK